MLLIYIALCSVFLLAVMADDQIPDDQGFVNLRITHENLSQSSSAKKIRNAIVLLIHKFDQSAIQELIHMVDNTLEDDYHSDFIIFHSHYPFQAEISQIRGNTSRNVDFVNVDLCLLRQPNIPNFDLYKDDPTWSKRGKWAYHQMIRFWFHDIFFLPVMQNVEYYMRIDDDSKFKAKFKNVFNIMEEKKGKNLLYVHRRHLTLNSQLSLAVYMSNVQAGEVGPHILPGIQHLGPTATKYVADAHVDIKNPKKWAEAFVSDAPQTYSTNFEVVKLDFFRSEEIKKWMDFILLEGGIYKYRWGDAPLRFATLAIFATDEQVLHRQDFQIEYCHPC
jgi:hypothetical protein